MGWRRLRSRAGAWGGAHPRILPVLKGLFWIGAFEVAANLLGRLFPAQAVAVGRVWREVLPGIFLAGGLALAAAFAVVVVQDLSGRRVPKPGSALSRGDRIFLAALILLGGAAVCFLDSYFAAADQRIEQAGR